MAYFTEAQRDALTKRGPQTTPGQMPAQAVPFNADPMPTDMGYKYYAQASRAWLARQEYADYQQRYQPVERELIDAVTTPEMLDQRLAAIKINSAAATNASSQIEQQMLQRYGVRPSAQAQQANATSRQIAATLGGIDAANNTRQHVYDRNMNAISGSGTARSSIQPGQAQ